MLFSFKNCSLPCTDQLDQARREAIEAREREQKDEERRRNLAKLADFTKEITLGHTNWELVQYMLIGLNLAVEVAVQLYENYQQGGGERAFAFG